jgi:hypothetical protein
MLHFALYWHTVPAVQLMLGRHRPIDLLQTTATRLLSQRAPDPLAVERAVQPLGFETRFVMVEYHLGI